MSRGLTVPTTFTAVDKFSRVVSGMTGAMNNFVAKSRVGFAYAERGFRQMLSPLTAMNRMMAGLGVYVGLYSFISIFRDVIKTIADFEQAQINISAVNHQSLLSNKALADQARLMAVQYGGAAKAVSELQLELIKMGFTTKQTLGSTPAIVTGATALRTQPEELGKIVGAFLKSFPGKTEQDVPLFVDQLAKIADITALDASSIFAMLERAMPYASLAGVEPSEMLSMMGALKNSMLPVASSATGLKNIWIDSEIAAKDYRLQLEKIFASPKALQEAKKMFGRKTASSAIVLSRALGIKDESGMSDLQRFQDALDPSKTQVLGYAAGVAAVQLTGFWGMVNKTKTAYQEYLLSIEDGNGKYAVMAKSLVQTTQAMFLLSAGTPAAQTELATMNQIIIDGAKNWIKWIDRVITVVKWLLIMKATLIAWRIATAAAAVVTGVFNVALGIMGALSGTASVMIGRSTIALIAYRATAALATAATWLWNAALNANPVMRIITGIGLLITALIALRAEYSKTPGFGGNIMGPKSEPAVGTIYWMMDKMKPKQENFWSDSLGRYVNSPDSVGGGYGINSDSVQRTPMVDRSTMSETERWQNLEEYLKEKSQLELTIRTDAGVKVDTIKNTGGTKVKFGSTMTPPDSK